MSFRLVEVHLPGSKYDQKNELPFEYHGVLDILRKAGINPLTTIVVAYSHQERDALKARAEDIGMYNVTYTGTYGDLPSENLDEFLVGSKRQWDFIIAGRYWGACHYSAYAHLLQEIEKRNPHHVNFHFIKPLIDGINKQELTDLTHGVGIYANDAYHKALYLRILQDGKVRHEQYKTTIHRGSNEPSFPSSMTTIDLHFWTSLDTMVQRAKTVLSYR